MSEVRKRTPVLDPGHRPVFRAGRGGVRHWIVRAVGKRISEKMIRSALTKERKEAKAEFMVEAKAAGSPGLLRFLALCGAGASSFTKTSSRKYEALADLHNQENMKRRLKK